MTIAELRGKISSSGANVTDTSEDLLTSDVFGCLRYVPPERGLVPFLETARSLTGEKFCFGRPILRTWWAFWPLLRLPGRIPCEPDVVIGLESAEGIHLVMVEVKYLSEKSSWEDEGERPNDQLARELDNLDVLKPSDLGWNTPRGVVDRWLLYITQDASIASTTLVESLQEYKRKCNQTGMIYWTSWRLLSAMLEEQVRALGDECQALVLDDMRLLLERKGLTLFTGMSPLTTTFDQRAYAFYSPSPTRYRWPGISGYLKRQPTYLYSGGSK